MTIPEILRRRAVAEPDRPFLLFEGESLALGEIDRRTDRIAARLLREGVGRGDRVAVQLENRPEFVLAWFAILKAGAALVPINPHLTPREIDYLVEDSGAALVLRDEHFEGGFEDDPRELPAVAPDDLAALVYTSGTTGAPKGAMLTHRNYVWDAEAIVAHTGMDERDRFLCFLPLFHVNAQVVTTLAPLVGGASMVLMRKFSPLEMLETLAATGATAFSGVPTVYAILNDAPGTERFDLAGLRFCVCGAAPMPVEVFETFERKFHTRILEGYGLTEATCASSVNPLDRRKVGSIGVPLPGQDMRVAEDGEILIRGPNVMQGYWKRPEATAEALRDGWLHTGDLGRVDEDGYFWVLGRKKEMIIRGGENVYPKEIEDVLFTHPAIADAAVVGEPDAKWGERVVAHVVARGAPDPEALIDFCRERLARFKCPERIVFHEALPKTPTGKVQKHLLAGN